MSRRRYNEPPPHYPPPWLWLSAGGLIGFTLAFLLFSSRLFPANQPQPVAATPPASVVADAPEQAQATATPVAPEPDKTAGKEAEKNADKDKHKTPEKDKPAAPRFEFYDVLSGDGQPQPPATPPPGSPINPAESAPIQPPVAPLVAADSVPPVGSFLLQLASFQKQEDANAFYQRLAQLGFQPSIQRATINGADWFRVRIGPYSSQEQLSHQRELLRQHKIAEGMVLKF